MCSTTAQRSVGAVFYIIGFLVAGIMFCIIGSEYNKPDTSNDQLRTFFWIYAIALFFAAIGTILENGDRFCGEEDAKNVDYFGGLFQLVSVFAWSGFGAGIAHFYQDEQYWADRPTDTVINTVSANERSSLAWLSGVAAIVFLVGSLLTMKRLLCCDGFKFTMAVAKSFAEMFLCIILVVFWFLYADKLNKDLGETAADDDRRTFSYLIGVVYIIFALVGILLFFDFCKMNRKPYGKKPVVPYGTKPAYGAKPGYGAKPVDPTPGYVQTRPAGSYQ